MAIVPGEQGGGRGHGSGLSATAKPDKLVQRHVYGPRPVQALIPALIRPAFKRRASGTAAILADWDVIAGPALAAAIPRRLFSGTLSIACPGHVALELQHLSVALIGRINAHLGRIAVTRLRFVQNETTDAVVVGRHRPPATEAARAAVETLPPGPLRDALEALGRVVLRPPAP